MNGKRTFVFGLLALFCLAAGAFLYVRSRPPEEPIGDFVDNDNSEDQIPVDSLISVDGYSNYIAFTRGLILDEVIDRIEVNRGSIWIVDPRDPEGTLKQIVEENDTANLMPSWSPDKSKIVFASNRSREAGNRDQSPFLDLWVLDFQADNNLVRITNSEGHDWTPAWSPDGSKIAYASTAQSNDPDDVSNLNIWVVDADGQNPHELADNGMQDEDPVFSADGSVIYYVAATDECYALWQAADSPSSKATPLLDVDGNTVCGEDPSLSPDGKKLYFWGNENGQLEAIDLETGEILFFSYDALEPWISPDEKNFVYVGDLDYSAGGDLYVSGLDGEYPKQITSGQKDMFPRW